MRRIPQGWLAFGLLAATFTYCLAEELTLTTYYPSPRGVYQELRVSGNLAIGTTNPPSASKLHLNTGINQNLQIAPHTVIGGTTGGMALRTLNDAADDFVPMHFEASAYTFTSGNVGIGTLTPGAKLHVEGNEPHIRFTDTRGNRSWVLRNNFGPAANELLFMTSDDTSDAKVRFSTNGHVGIGTAPSNDGVLTLNSTSHYVSGLLLTQSDDLGQPGPFLTLNRPLNPSVTWNWMVNDGTGALRWTNSLGTGNTMILDPNGNLSITGSYSPSDARMKTNIETIAGALPKVTALRGVRFEWKDPSRGTGPQIGVIAEDVEKSFPELVKVDDEGMKSVAYDRLLAPMIEAIKEQQAELQQLKEELAELKSHEQ